MKETGKVFGVLQRVGRAFMLPIAVLPVARSFAWNWTIFDK